MKKVCRLIILSLLALTMAFGFTACNDGEKVKDNPYRLTGVNVFDKGCYILGDLVYGAKKQPYNIQGQLLIANHIEFYEPETNELLSFSVPLTQEFQEILSKLPRF